MKKLLLVGLLIGLSCRLFCQEFETFENKDKKYTIDFPKGWITAYDKNSLISILAANDGDDISRKLMVVTSKAAAMSTKDLYRSNLRSIRSGKNNTVEEEGTTTINGMEAMWTLYSVDQDGTKTKVKVYVMKNKNTQYLVQSVIPADDFDASVAFFDNIIATFKTF